MGFKLGISLIIDIIRTPNYDLMLNESLRQIMKLPKRTAVFIVLRLQ